VPPFIIFNASILAAAAAASVPPPPPPPPPLVAARQKRHSAVFPTVSTPSMYALLNITTYQYYKQKLFIDANPIVALFHSFSEPALYKSMSLSLSVGPFSR
jgi:hypothetical protein